MKITEKHGKNTKHVIEQFKKETGFKDYDFTYEVIQEPTKGFLGLFGGKKAIVKFTIDDIEEGIRDYLREFSIYTQVTMDKIVVKKTDKFVFVEIMEVSDPGFLIGKDGSFLYNLQYILNLSFSAKLTRQRSIILDVAGYRKRQKQNMNKKFKETNAENNSSKKNINFDSMTSTQRKYAHQTISKNKMTNGDDNNKRIVNNSDKNNSQETSKKHYRKPYYHKRKSSS